MIECKFRTRREFELSVSEKEKLGKYHSSFFYKVPGFGRDKWVIVAEIDVLGEDCILDEHSLDWVAEECITYLNQPPVRKRKTKKKPKLPYGNLEVHKASLKRDKSGNYMQVLLVTDERKNKHFWGKGVATLVRSHKRK